MDDQLQELLDKKACEEVLMRYGRTLDWLDEEGHASCFWPDAAIDYGFYEGDGAGWVPLVMDVEKSAARRWHLCGGVIITIEGATANSECYGLTVSSTSAEDGSLGDMMFGGRYLDQLEKRDGEWRVLKRRYVLDWTHQFPNGLDAAAEGGLSLKILQILEPGHVDYRPL